MKNYTYGNFIIYGDGNVKVGNFCSIGANVTAITHGHDMQCISTFPFCIEFNKEWENTSVLQNRKIKNIIIGNDVWIGNDTIIMDDIEDGAVIGAGSVVRDKIPAYAIAYGNPCKVIRYRFNEKQIESLLKIKWWNFDDERLKKYIHLLTNKDIDKFIKDIE